MSLFRKAARPAVHPISRVAAMIDARVGPPDIVSHNQEGEPSEVYALAIFGTGT
jgi:hypothetical protein